MKLEQVELPVSNQLLFDYWSHSEKVKPFYQYEYNDDAFVLRYNYLKEQFYDSQQLGNIIRTFMQQFGLSKKQEEHIHQLENGAVAVVGGQQAGVLTGPLYSVHKAISVILLAKEQSEKLGEKVVPLFWIAGEDHDIEEINHTYTIVDSMPKKRVYGERSHKKLMASKTPLQKEQLVQFIDAVFKDYGETEYTNDLYHFVLRMVEQSETFTQFFAHTMNGLFQTEGLLMIDAAYAPFRKYESSFFEKIINHNEQIAMEVVAQEKAFDQAGYGTPINAVVGNANLFYVKDGERFLLERKNGDFQDASGLHKFTKEHLLDIALTNPEQLSNNVVTRPLMQEMTIPVLAFVGGPGELAYWATLKNAFSALNLQMPILAPRLNISLMTRKVDQLLADFQLSMLQVIEGGATEQKEQFINSVQDVEAKNQIEAIHDSLQQQYAELMTHLDAQQLNLKSIVEKNKGYHKKQLDYLSSKIEQQVRIKHDKTIRQFNTISAELYPNGTLQERVYNPFQYLNLYGPSLIEDLCALPMKIANIHYVVRL
ncbi:bacillithiol biosynthesis cysteine-adding enzyme BshC [Lysinibacillus sp. BW-2-10]|uniref:bacillithiol biosynthesis cysteine-adding enzyme BshC n=1 Tax=Lysinibacillus sp. BW-2-10 TaxID=2590030 RepID=UPI00117ED152|nr:bacillithiol biosynthesis cysteine-adding enzyme BshC [Lysinibacillus sp. BW-2-10]TSI11516.1 bacillithiol biosynthesis cysteine-adding enzyme BshC [Lysinibacillus sp. BW-2-10]